MVGIQQGLSIPGVVYAVIPGTQSYGRMYTTIANNMDTGEIVTSSG